MDALGLDAFCLSYFPDVHDSFGRGLRKDEKITMLLDHCQRRDDLASLLTALEKQA